MTRRSKWYKELSLDYLKSRLDYDPITGVFRWKGTATPKVRGKIAGCMRSDGYLIIGLKAPEEILYLAHRLAWFYFYGKWPDNTIDHIDRNKSNNAISNLRDASQTVNNLNRPPQSNNKSGYSGVDYFTNQSSWRARFNAVHIGYFKTKEEAIEARMRYLREHYPELSPRKETNA